MVFELAFADGGAVDVGAVGAAQILDGYVDSVEGEGAMLAAYQLVVHADIGVLSTPENDCALFKRNLLELVLRVKYNQVRPHLRDGQLDRVSAGNRSIHILHSRLRCLYSVLPIQI